MHCGEILGILTDGSSSLRCYCHLPYAACNFNHPIIHFFLCIYLQRIVGPKTLLKETLSLGFTQFHLPWPRVVFIACTLYCDTSQPPGANSAGVHDSRTKQACKPPEIPNRTE